MTDPSAAERVFLAAIADLKLSYSDQTFWVERDVVLWLQRRITGMLPTGMTVFNDFGLMPGPRRARSADLAILDGGRVQLAAEFKFEPAASRTDIMANKLPVIGWGDYEKDVERIKEFVGAGVTPLGWAICIDEGGRYAHRLRLPITWVESWSTGRGTQATFTRWPKPLEDTQATGGS